MRITYLCVPVVALAVSGLAGCSVADPNPSEIGLKYNGGPFSNQQFLDCVAPGTRDINGPNDQYFYYPHGTRTFNFAGAPGQPAPGADEGAILVNTKPSNTGASIQMVVTGSITFTLNENCSPYTDKNGHVWPGGIIQKFHDTIGRSHNMFAADSNANFGDHTGWGQGLNLFLGGPAGKALNNAGLGYTWQDLYSNLDARNAFVRAAEADIKLLITQQAGDDFFLIQNVQIDQPQPPGALTDQMNGLQAQLLENQKAQQARDQAVNWPGGIPGYVDFQRQQAITKAIGDGRVNPLIVPQGSPVIVGGR
jgi:hypothetical protein